MRCVLLLYMALAAVVTISDAAQLPAPAMETRYNPATSTLVVTLTAAPSSPPDVKYQIERQESGKSNWELLQESSSQLKYTIADKQWTPGANYNIKVTAAAGDSSASLQTQLSIPATAPTAASATPTSASQPAMPTGFKVVSTSEYSVTVSWTPTPNTRSRIYWSTPSAQAPQVTNIPAGVHQHTLSGLKPDTQYKLQLAAVQGNEPGVESVKADLTVKTSPPPKPPTVNAVTPASGPISGGTDITIFGSGFGSKAGEEHVCKFGSSNEEITASRLSPTQLKVTTPTTKQAGTVIVKCRFQPGEYGASSGKFTYTQQPSNTPPPSVTAISPATGTVAGGTQIIVYGSNFGSGSETTFCLFNDQAVTGARLNAGQVRCTTPAHTKAEQVQVKVRRNGDAVSTQSVKFTYTDDKQSAVYDVRALSPATGPTSGGSQIIVLGSGFGVAASDRFTCQFDTMTVPGTRMSPTQIRCSSPPAKAAGQVDFKLKKNDLPFAKTILKFNYVASATGTLKFTLASVTPAAGGADGGTQVVIRGSGFGTGAEQFECKFGNSVVAVRRLSPAVLSTSSPKSKQGGGVTVDVSCHVMGGPWVSGLKYNYISPTSTPSNAEVKYIVPVTGDVTGGTQVLVHGNNFPSMGTGLRLLPGLQLLQCRFGSDTSTGRRIGPTMVACAAPKANKPGPVPLAVSFDDGKSWINNPKVTFTYVAVNYDKTMIRRIYPARGSAGTSVKVIGENFGVGPSTVYTCKFGSNEVNAERLSSRVLRCTAPEVTTTESADLDFAITINGDKEFKSPVKFHYYASKDSNKETDDWLGQGYDHVMKQRPVSIALIIGISAATFVVMTILLIALLVAYQAFCARRRKRRRRTRLEDEDLGEELSLVDENSHVAKRSATRDMFNRDLELADVDIDHDE